MAPPDPPAWPALPASSAVLPPIELPPLLGALPIVEDPEETRIRYLAMHRAAMERGADCTRCPLFGCGRGPVPSTVVPGATMAIGGEGPGGHECEKGENFVGYSGIVLDEALIIGHQRRDEQTIINAIGCRHSENKDEGLEEWIGKMKRRANRAHAAKLAEIERRREAGEPIDEATADAMLAPFVWVSPVTACRPRFERDLDETKPRVYLAIGKFALASFEDYLRSRNLYDGEGLVMSRVHGAPVPLTARAEVGGDGSADVAPDWGGAAHGGDGAGDAGSTSSVVSDWGGASLFLFASYHPVFATHDPKWHRFVRANIVRAAEVATRGYIEWSEPEYAIDYPVEWIVGWLRWVRENRYETTVDLETCDPKTGKPSADIYECDLRCIGEGVRVPLASGDVFESVVVVPWRNMDGTFWAFSAADRVYARALAASWVGEAAIDAWTYALPPSIHGFPLDPRDAIVRWVLTVEHRQTFDAVSIVGHNIIVFDSPIMLRLGLLSDPTRGVVDTLLLHHNTPSQDHSHSLSFVHREYTEMPAYKTKEDIASTDNADNGKLKLRCAKDVLAAMRCLEPMRSVIEAKDTIKQNDTDHKVGVIERNTTSMGLCVDERERGFWSRVLGREAARLRARWIELVGRDVNPQSPPQLQQLFYGDWGLDPPVSVGGDTWDPEFDDDDDKIDDDEGSTGVRAVLAIVDMAERQLIDLGGSGGRAVAERRLASFDTLLELKAMTKPLGTYVNMPVRTWPRDRWSDEAIDLVLNPDGDLPARPSISRIRPIASMGRTPIGRAAWKRPAEQQRPKQGRRIEIPAGEQTGAIIDTWYEKDRSGELILKKGKIDAGTYLQQTIWLDANMRRIIRPAPGHRFVGADYKSSHVRIYGAQSLDEVIYGIVVGGWKDPKGNAVDPHSYNAATYLAAKDPSSLWEHYIRIEYGAPAYREYWRFVAKKAFFAFIYGAHGEKLYEVMRAERLRTTGKRAFPGIRLAEDCVPWFHAHHEFHPWTIPWQESEKEKYRARGYAMSEGGDDRKRFAPLEENMIANVAILAKESWVKNRAVMIIEDLIPHGCWSDWTGLAYDGHDSLVIQCPDDEKMVKYTREVLDYAMAYDENGMPYRGDVKVIANLGKL